MTPGLIEEMTDDQLWGIWECTVCGAQIGGEGSPQDFDGFVREITWTDEALYQLDRLPPYLEPLVRDEVVSFTRQRHQWVVTHARMISSQHKGIVVWNPEAQKRLANIPAPVRAMAKVELERTAIDRNLPEVTVSLMEELKARYFGLGAGRS
ncbi:MAG: PCP reductase family protein [Nitrospirales bacterium]|nr:PCP reductase family protein [Nitrospirales bacterium]